MAAIISLLALGIFSGILAGLLGVGGGVIIVPVLIWIFHWYPEIPTANIMHIALATSLATIVLTSLSSIRAHQKHGAIQWPVAGRLTFGILAGALAGTAVASFLSSDALKIVFALFLLLISMQLGFGAQPSPQRQLPGRLGMNMAGLIIGKMSALVGIGGGSLTVPFLVWCNISMRNAVATSATCGFPIAVASTVGYIVAGWHMDLAWSSGYVYWPAVLAIAPASLLFAPVGAKLAHSISTTSLKKFFSVFLAVISISMLAPFFFAFQ